MSARCVFVPAVLLLFCSSSLVGQPGPRSFDYDYSSEAAKGAALDLDNPDQEVLRNIFSLRRKRVLQALPEGAMLIMSVERTQPRRLEFQVPHSDNHDFIYLTGLEGIDSLDSALLLFNSDGQSWEILYTSAKVESIQKLTGVKEVRPFTKLEEDLSVAVTDYRDWRITQIRRWPISAALSKTWGPSHKVLFLNYPRFFRLGMVEPPRLSLFEKLSRFSPELVRRDSADVLDVVRMLQDSYSLANLRRAVEITGEGIIEGLRSVAPGKSEKQIMEVMDFVYRYRGAVLGFPTAVRRMPPGGREEGRSIPEGYIQFVPRSGAALFQAGDMVHTDTGAAFNHYSADLQRNVPVSGKFTEEQRRLYTIALDVQKTVISRVRPGATWWDLHNLAVQMLREAGGYDKYYTYGIGHFIGMEVHDEGDYERPLQAGMVLSIEQGVAPPDGPRIAFEDDVIVTSDGYEWISRSVPIEIDEVEAMAAVASRFEVFMNPTRQK